MNIAVFLPLLLPLSAWPLARLVAPRLPPRFASWLLVLACVMLAAASTTSLALLAFSWLSVQPAVAGAGHWSADVLRTLAAVNVPVDVCCGMALAVISVSVVVGGLRHLRWTARVRAQINRCGGDSELVVLPDEEPFAAAVPVAGGRIVVSRGMLAALGGAQRRALLAHERVHLRCGHHRFLAAAELSVLVNPLLRPLRTAIVFTLERWADEAAAQRVGDRRVVATAVAMAAMATRGTDASRFSLAATGGPVPRRVAALLAPPGSGVSGRASAWLAVLVTAVTVVIAASAAEAAVTAASDLHDDLVAARSAERPPIVPSVRCCAEQGRGGVHS